MRKSRKANSTAASASVALADYWIYRDIGYEGTVFSQQLYSNLTDEQQQIVTEDLNCNEEMWNVLGTDDDAAVYI